MKKIMALFLIFVAVSLFSISAKVNAIYTGGRAGRVKAQVMRSGSMIWKNLTIGSVLEAGDKIRTGRRVRLDIMLDDGSVIKIAPSSTFKIEDLSEGINRKASFKLLTGIVRSKIQKLTKDDTFMIKTPTAVAGVRGTDFVVGYGRGASDKTSVYVVEGKVEVGNEATSAVISAGQKAFVGARDTNIPIQAIGSDDLEKLNEELNDPKDPITGVKTPTTTTTTVAVETTTTTEQITTTTIETTPTTIGTTATTLPEGGIDTGLENSEIPQDTQEESKATTDNAAASTQEKQDLKDELKEEASMPFASGFNMNSSIGPIVIGDKTWTKLVLMPTVAFGKIKIAFYIPIIFDSNKRFIDFDNFGYSWYNGKNFGQNTGDDIDKNEWDFRNFADFWHDLILKIKMAQYGRKRDPIYAALGNIPDFVIGHGFVVNHYANDTQFPVQRRIGLQFDIDFGKFGFESMFNDLADLYLYGGRLYFRPLRILSDAKGILGSLALGFSYVIDNSPLDSAVTNYGKPNISAGSVDLEMIVVKSKLLTILAFADWAKMAYQKEEESLTWADGSGISTGFMGNILFINYMFAYRVLNKNFIPQYFDVSYDNERESKASEFMQYIEGSAVRDDFVGWIGEGGFQYEKKIIFSFNYQEYYGQVDGKDTTINYLHGEFVIGKDLLQKVYGSFSYDRNDFSFSDLINGFIGDKTTLKATVCYQVDTSVAISANYRWYYTLDENGNLVEDKSFSIDTELSF